MVIALSEHLLVFFKLCLRSYDGKTTEEKEKEAIKQQNEIKV